MSDYKTEVIILRSWKSKEYDRIYSVFSREHGKMRVIGIGTRRPKAKLASGLEPMTRSDIFLVKCRALDRVKGTIVLRQYTNLKKHLDNLIEGKKTINILERLLGDNEPHEEIFIAMKDYFKLIDKISEANILMKECHKEIGGNIITKNLPTTQLAQLALFWKIIYWSGYFPRFKHCTYCDQKITERESYEFILSQGVNCGCQNVATQNLKINLSKNIIKLIKFLVAQDIEHIRKLRVSTGDFQDLKQFTKLILEQVTERRVDL
jgi:DNA repair protein RecO (recombination protein O)